MSKSDCDPLSTWRQPACPISLVKDSDVARHMSANFSPMGQPCGNGPREWRRFSKFFTNQVLSQLGYPWLSIHHIWLLQASWPREPSARENNSPELEMYKILTQSVVRCFPMLRYGTFVPLVTRRGKPLLPTVTRSVSPLRHLHVSQRPPRPLGYY